MCNLLFGNCPHGLGTVVELTVQLKVSSADPVRTRLFRVNQCGGKRVGMGQGWDGMAHCAPALVSLWSTLDLSFLVGERTKLRYPTDDQ